MRYLCALILPAILAACASGPYPVSSPFYRIPEGSRLVLKQSLAIAPNSARVYMQYGKVVTAAQTDKYYPHCWFQSSRLLNSAQIIKPDTFIVTKTQKYEERVRTSVSDQVASTSIFGGIRPDAGQFALEYITELSIRSESQPDIRWFACNQWEDPANASHLTVNEIRNTLGAIAELQLLSPP